MVIIAIYSLISKKSISPKPIIKMSNLQNGSFSEKLDYFEPEEVLFERNAHDFSFIYSVIDKFELLNKHRYLMAKKI